MICDTLVLQIQNSHTKNLISLVFDGMNLEARHIKK